MPKISEWLKDYEIIVGDLEPVNDIIDQAAQIIKELYAAILEANALDMGDTYEIPSSDTFLLILVKEQEK